MYNNVYGLFVTFKAPNYLEDNIRNNFLELIHVKSTRICPLSLRFQSTLAEPRIHKKFERVFLCYAHRTKVTIDRLPIRYYREFFDVERFLYQFAKNVTTGFSAISIKAIYIHSVI